MMVIYTNIFSIDYKHMRKSDYILIMFDFPTAYHNTSQRSAK